MSQEWSKVSKNERHGYEDPAAAPPPAPESAEQFWLKKYGHGSYALSFDGMLQFCEAYAAHLQAELQAAHKTVYDIQTVAYEANQLLEKRAEQAEARCRVLEEALRAAWSWLPNKYYGDDPDKEQRFKELTAMIERTLAPGQEEKS